MESDIIEINISGFCRTCNNAQTEYFRLLPYLQQCADRIKTACASKNL